MFTVKHEKISSKADGEDDSLIQPSHWNEDHKVELSGSSLVGRSAGAAGLAESIGVLPDNGLLLEGSQLKFSKAGMMSGEPVIAAPWDALLYPAGARALTNNDQGIEWDKTVANQIKGVIAAEAVTFAHLAKQSRGGVIVYGANGAPQFLAPTKRGEVLISGDSATTAYFGGIGAPHAYARGQQATGVSDGNHPAATWHPRNLSNQVFDYMGILELGPITGVPADQFRLQAGTYVAEWSAPGYKTNGFQSRLYNVTDDTQVAPGASAFTDKDGGVMVVSTGMVKFAITAQKNFRIETRAQQTHANGCGIASGSGQAEIYSWVKVWRMDVP